MKKGFTIPELAIIVSVIGIFVFMALPRLSDVKDSSKAAGVQKDLVDLRVALEDYYTQVEEYPALMGVEDVLEDVSGRGSDGSQVTFAGVLGRRKMPSTPEVEGMKRRNTVNDLQDFRESDGSGGWNYNYGERTGEIHANLPAGIFRQSIDWNEQ